MNAMDEIISFSPDRREYWKALSPNGVKQSIRYARRYNDALRLFRVGADAEGWVTYTEIPPAQWDDLFFDQRTEA